MENYQQHEKSFLTPPSNSVEREKLQQFIAEQYRKKDEMEDMPGEWTRKQECEYEDILSEIRLAEKELGEML